MEKDIYETFYQVCHISINGDEIARLSFDTEQAAKKFAADMLDKIPDCKPFWITKTETIDILDGT